ncbi:MAG: cyclic nucleotide-binding domain-containing protein [Microthrixaceae bacterium]
MRHHSSVTSLSWIPSEAVTGLNKAVFDTGFTHYDDPPPDVIDDLEALRDEDRFRFANRLAAWIEVEDGRIVDAGYDGGCLMGATTVAVGASSATFAAVALPDIQAPIERTQTTARFVQTVGGHTAVPAPRRVNHPPFVQFQAPTVWSTLALTVHADGQVEHELLGASTFPRHWVYDANGKLTAKAGLADFKDWWRHSFGKHTPWGDQDSEVLVTEVETALERDVATLIMRGGAKPGIRKVKAGATLTEQGAPGDDVFLLLNGVLSVEVGGEPLAEVGPGAILGERAVLEEGTRTSTLRALTKVKVATIAADQVDRDALATISRRHRREEDRPTTGSTPA